MRHENKHISSSLGRFKTKLCNFYLNIKEPGWRKKHIRHDPDHKLLLLRDIKMAVFDLDGTLTNCVNSWKLITQLCGARQQLASRNFRRYLRGQIDAQQLYTKAISLWKPRPSRDFFLELCKKIELNPGAIELIAYLKKISIETAVVSTGINVFAEHVAKRLGIKNIFANILEFDAQGLLEGVKVNVTFATKRIILDRLSKNLAIPQKQIMFIGDCKYDLEPVQWAGVGVFLDNGNADKTKAKMIISSLTDLLDAFKKRIQV